VQSGQEVACGLFVACRDAPILLDCIEESLDEISLGVECEVAGPLTLRVDLGGMTALMARTSRAGDGSCPHHIPCRREGLGLDLGCQRFRLGDVVSIAAGEAECQWVAKGVDNQVDFRRKAARERPMAWS